MEKTDITLRRIKNTQFPDLYKKFILNELNESDNIKLLSIAIIFLNSKNLLVNQLGYRIIVIYCNRAKDFKPLYEVALNKGFIPIVKFIDSLTKDNAHSSFFLELNSSFLENYNILNNYRTVEQKELIKFYNDNNSKSILAIAPTSYGKTELILSTIKESLDSNICIITPSKSLLSQTKQRILNEEIEGIIKVIVHPEMYLGSEKNIVTVLTQERLLRMLKMFPKIKFDYAIIDEAHNLLGDEERNELLASVIILLEKRNPTVRFKFLTPFLENGESLKVKYTNFNIESFKVLENIKTEKYYIYDLEQKRLLFYDQFINETVIANDNCPERNDMDFIFNYSLEKNIIYLNRPIHVEQFALRFSNYLPDIKSDIIEKVCNNIADYINVDYNLIKCLKKGIIYHHGSMPDSIRAYIEKSYLEIDEIKYVITTSTLLEGVNLPAYRLFLLDNRRGQGNLTRSSFKNLIGRICRFNDIFNSKNENLNKLEPHVYFVVGEFYRINSDVQNFLRKVACVGKNVTDKIENVLLENTESIDEDKFNKTLEFIENFEENTLSEYNGQYVQTEVGKSCFLNNVFEINVVDYEREIQDAINVYQKKNLKINDTQTIMDIIYNLFVSKVNFETNNYDNLKRLTNEKARTFYKMFIDWRIKNASYPEMLATFYKYWEELIDSKSDTMIYVGKWGDEKRGGFRELWTDIGQKNYIQKINLAIVRIKDEQDFLENNLLKYIEVLNDCEILEESLYLRIKYGTDNQAEILLVRNGLSLGLAKLLTKKYSIYVNINYDSYEIDFNKDIIHIMIENEENEIHINELQMLVFGK
ncbi:MAG: DEAD/DEAH box helicase family protein [Longicatena sp.]|uniref:DEAD/DEAH box helicase n=1 Tax=Anaerorhabdus sp. TaxID=1872524 RepID=UPI002FCA0A3D